MSTTQEKVSDAATVPAAPRAVPPPTRRRRKGKTLPHLDYCLNCGRPTGEEDNFCPNCGQENEDETVPLKPLIADALSEMASWDSKLTRTIVPLLFRPGFLTDEFLAGRRVRYLSPLKMYLVISAVFFLLLPFSPLAQDMSVNPNGVSLHPARATGHITFDNGTGEHFVVGGNTLPDNALPKTVAAYYARQRDTRQAHRDGFWKSLLLRQIIKARQDKQTFAQSVIQGLLGDLPKMMFALLPLFALLLKITYWRRRRLYIEHLIFSLHSHAFTFFLLTLAVLSPRAHVPEGLTATALGVLLPVYLFAALRRVYQQSWWTTALTFSWLAFNYVILLSFAFTLTALAAFLLA